MYEFVQPINRYASQKEEIKENEKKCGASAANCDDNIHLIAYQTQIK